MIDVGIKRELLLMREIAVLPYNFYLHRYSYYYPNWSQETQGVKVEKYLKKYMNN